VRKNAPHCGVVVEDWQAYCRNGDLVGFPNYRAADAERPELEKRARAAREDAQKRGITSLLAKLEALAERSRPLIAMGFSICDDILRSDKYGTTINDLKVTSATRQKQRIIRCG
jgi:hypothetical protein